MTKQKNLVFFDYSVSLDADIFYGADLPPPFWKIFLDFFSLWSVVSPVGVPTADRGPPPIPSQFMFNMLHIS
jgi:hypothetical protein